MEWMTILFIVLGTLLLSLLAGLPVFAAFLLTDFLGVFLFMGGVTGLDTVVRSMLNSIGTFTLAPVPLFILMGEVIFSAGLASKAIDVVERVLEKLPGSLAMVAIGGATVFAALSGSALGTCAMFGSLLVPEMTKRNYSRYMSVGPIMAGSSLAVIIPPSTLTVVLAAQAGISVGKLLVAGILPGLLLASLFAGFIVLSAMVRPEWAPKATLGKASGTSLVADFFKYLLPLSSIILAVLGSIFSGIATPTEASALGALTCFVLAAIYRKLNRTVILKSARRTLGYSTMILMIVAGSVAFSQILAYTGITRGLVQMATGMEVSPLVLAALMLGILVIMGTVIEQISMIMIAVPIFMPIASAQNFDPIWFGLLMLIAITLGLMTPPFGLLLFIAKGAGQQSMPMADVYRAAIPYIVLVAIGLTISLLVPGLVTWLPSLM